MWASLTLVSWIAIFLYIYYYYLVCAVPEIFDSVISCRPHVEHFIQLGFSDTQHHRSRSQSVSPVWPDHFFGIGPSLSKLYPQLLSLAVRIMLRIHTATGDSCSEGLGMRLWASPTLTCWTQAVSVCTCTYCTFVCICTSYHKNIWITITALRKIWNYTCILTVS